MEMTASAKQPAIQAWLDNLTPVERHRVCRVLNEYELDKPGILELVWAYDVDFLVSMKHFANRIYSTATGGQE